MSGFSKVQMSVFPQDNPITTGFGGGHGQNRSHHNAISCAIPGIVIHTTSPEVDWVAMVFNAQPARWAFFIAEPV